MPLKHEDMQGLCLRWASGNEAAAAFLSNWAALVRVADDVADGDAENPVLSQAQVLMRCLIQNGNNTFYQQNQGALDAVMSNAILLWVKSEDWRKSDNRKTRMFGFIGREAVEHVAYAVAMLTGGFHHALTVAQEMQELSHQTSPETFEDWEAE
jgi:hypothetical protein